MTRPKRSKYRHGSKISPAEKRRIKEKYLEVLSDGGFKYDAADAVFLSYSTLALWRAEDPGFAMDCIAAEAAGGHRIFEKHYSRVLEGDEYPELHNGKQVFIRDEKTGEMVPLMKRSYDSRLVVTYLQALDPLRFCPNVRAKRIERELWPEKKESDDGPRSPEAVEDLAKALEAIALAKAETRGEDEDPPT